MGPRSEGRLGACQMAARTPWPLPMRPHRRSALGRLSGAPRLSAWPRHLGRGRSRERCDRSRSNSRPAASKRVRAGRGSAVRSAPRPAPRSSAEARAVPSPRAVERSPGGRAQSRSRYSAQSGSRVSRKFLEKSPPYSTGSRRSSSWRADSVTRQPQFRQPLPLAFPERAHPAHADAPVL